MGSLSLRKVFFYGEEQERSETRYKMVKPNKEKYFIMVVLNPFDPIDK